MPCHILLQVKAGVLFVWLESGPEAEAEAAAKQVSCIPATLRSRGWELGIGAVTRLSSGPACSTLGKAAMQTLHVVAGQCARLRAARSVRLAQPRLATLSPPPQPARS